MRTILNSLIDLLFPRSCHLCEAPLDKEERFICTTCLSRMPRTLYHRRDMNQMEQRFAGIFPFERATGHFFYSKGSDLSSLMQDLKYRHFQDLGKYLGEVVAKELYTSGFFNDIDMLVPIPMYFLKKARRGYNQTEEIAKGISKVTSLPISLNLIATRHHRTQTALTLQQRQENTADLFALKDPTVFSNKHLLVIDDVCTTGSTIISACSTIHAESPSSRISILTLGVTF